MDLGNSFEQAGVWKASPPPPYSSDLSAASVKVPLFTPLTGEPPPAPRQPPPSRLPPAPVFSRRFHPPLSAFLGLLETSERILHFAT